VSVLGETVRLRREERGLGQEQLAAALGVRQQTVSRWENGLAVPRPARVVELARLLDLEPARLHRLAGYLPAAEQSPVAEAWHEVYERMPELSRSELLLLIDRAWDELRAREGVDAAAPGDPEAVAG
jgi:transcriptional regulator with XRE-family HTH domain